MSDVERHIAQTHFCWAGGIDEECAFYYRIQGPVVMIEFDHHKGVVLNDNAPAAFPRPHHRSHTQWQRLRDGPLAIAL